MIENKDKKLIKYLNGLFDGKVDIMDLLKQAETDREKVLTLFLMSFGCYRILGLNPKELFGKFLKYKNFEDIDKIVKKEYEKSIKNKANGMTEILKEFIDKFSPELDEEYSARNKKFIKDNSDKFVLIKDANDTPSGISFYTYIDGEHDFDLDICFAKTFNSFDEANQYRLDNDLSESKIYSVEDCINFQ